MSERATVYVRRTFVIVFILGTAFAARRLGAQNDSSGNTRPEQTTASGTPENGMRSVVAPGRAPVTVSIDLLRHPITEKARRMLRKAFEEMNSSNHEAAIEQLQETLVKYPNSAPYVHSLLGVEYLKTSRYSDAISSFEQAVLLLPHDAVNRYNLGLSLACAGDLERSEQEVGRAIALDPTNTTMKALMTALREHRHAGN